MQPPLAPEKWKRQYPCFDGVSPLGAFFIPDEKSCLVRLQAYDAEFVCHWLECWIELKGHCIEIYEEQEAKEPVLVFDLKETVCFAAAKGLPGSAPDLACGRLAIFSRYYVHKSVSTNCFFIELPTPLDAKAWLVSMQVNREWALRHSALQHPLGSCQVSCELYEGKMVIRKRFSNTKLTPCSELHAKDLSEGKIEKLGGSRLEGRFQGREIAVRNGERLEYSSDGGVKGDIDLRRATVMLVCNDVLTKSKARKKPKASEAMEHVNWFGIMGEGDNRLFVFRVTDADIVERWCVSLSKLSTAEQSKFVQMIQMKEKQSLKSPARKVRYVGHPLPESCYGTVPRDGQALDASGSGASIAGSIATKESRHKSEGVSPHKGKVVPGGARPVSVNPGQRGHGALPQKPTEAGGGVSPRGNKSPGNSASRIKPGMRGKEEAIPASAPAPEPASADEPPADSAFQRLRRATQMMKSSAEARGVIMSVKGVDAPPARVASKGPSEKEIEEQQKAEMRRLAALERKKLREERERLKKQQGGDDDESGGGSGSGAVDGGGASRAELRALQAQLDAEVERRAAAEAANERLREKMESDKSAARELKQLAKDYRSKFEQSIQECEELRAAMEEQQQEQELMIEQHQAEIQELRRNAVSGSGAAGAMVDDMTAEINELKDSVAKLKAEARAQEKEIRSLQKAIQDLEKEKETLLEENDLLLGEVQNGEAMAEAVEGILALGDPAELVAQLEELLVENDALQTEVAELKKQVGRRR